MTYKNISNYNNEDEIPGESSICKQVEVGENIRVNQLYCCDPNNNKCAAHTPPLSTCFSPNQTAECYNISNFKASDVKGSGICGSRNDANASKVCNDNDFKNNGALFCVSVDSTLSIYPTFQKAIEKIVNRNSLSESKDNAVFYYDGNVYSIIPVSGAAANLTCGDWFGEEYSCYWQGVSARTNNPLCFERQPKGEICLPSSLPVTTTVAPTGNVAPTACVNVMNNMPLVAGLGSGLALTTCLAAGTFFWIGRLKGWWC